MAKTPGSVDRTGGDGDKDAVEMELVEFIDLAACGREGRTPDRARRYHLIIDGVQHIVHQHEMSVVGILDLAGKGPDEWVLELELHGGVRERLEAHDEVIFHNRGVVEFRTIRRHRHHHPKGFELTVVVNGDPIQPKVGADTLLSVVVTESLALAKAVGRPEDQWEIKNESGTVLDQALSLHEAHVESGATLYLSLKTGAAGEMVSEWLVDPAVSRAKFAAELDGYRAVEDGMIRRGQWVLVADFPTVFVVYGAAPSTLPHLVAFGAILDFTNYDLWPISVRIVNPFTRVPYKASELPPYAALSRIVKSMQPVGPGGTLKEVGSPQPLMQAHLPEEVPFLCLPGVREYHAHPAHTGDDWLLRRNTGEGTLYHLLDVLYQHGALPIRGLQAVVQVTMNPASL
jgi:hypothetical protein